MKTVGGTELKLRVCNLNWNLRLPQENTPWREWNKNLAPVEIIFFKLELYTSGNEMILVQISLRKKTVNSIDGMKMTGEHRSARRKSYPSAIFSSR